MDKYLSRFFGLPKCIVAWSSLCCFSQDVSDPPLTLASTAGCVSIINFKSSRVLMRRLRNSKTEGKERKILFTKSFQLSELLFDTIIFTSYEIKQYTCAMSYMTEQVLIQTQIQTQSFCLGWYHRDMHKCVIWHCFHDAPVILEAKWKSLHFPVGRVVVEDVTSLSASTQWFVFCLEICFSLSPLVNLFFLFFF